MPKLLAMMRQPTWEVAEEAMCAVVNALANAEEAVLRPFATVELANTICDAVVGKSAIRFRTIAPVILPGIQRFLALGKRCCLVFASSCVASWHHGGGVQAMW